MIIKLPLYNNSCFLSTQCLILQIEDTYGMIVTEKEENYALIDSCDKRVASVTAFDLFARLSLDSVISLILQFSYSMNIFTLWTVKMTDMKASKLSL